MKESMVFCERRVERGNTYIVVILFQVMCNWAFLGPPLGPLGFLCCFLHSSVCLAFEKKMICSIQLCCGVKSRVLLWMYECVSAPLLERQSPFVLTASHMLGHTAAP